MRIALFDARRFDREAFAAANDRFGFEITYFDTRLTAETARVAAGYPVVCPFVNDRLDGPALRALHAVGVRLIALRSAGFNNVDLAIAAELGIPVVRVPEYSPHAVAEHAVALLLAVVRKIHRAASRVRESNFSLDGLVGFDLFGKTVGLIGTGRIGRTMAGIMRGFGCRVIAFDTQPDEACMQQLQVDYVDLPALYAESDVISLHVPLTPQTRHMLDKQAFSAMKTGVVLINTSRGALIDTRALIEALKQGRIGAAGLDVYEEEAGIFFSDHSDHVLQDDVLARLLTFPNVLVTSHQGFLTHEALANIADTTLANVRAFERNEPLVNQVQRG